MIESDVSAELPDTQFLRSLLNELMEEAESSDGLVLSGIKPGEVEADRPRQWVLSESSFVGFFRSVRLV